MVDRSTGLDVPRVQDIAIADRAYQQALAYSKMRIQSRPVDGSSASAVAIIHRPDIRRMLSQMRTATEACRALVAYAAGRQDLGDTPLAEFLVPLVKGFCTELAVQTTCLGVQIPGGMGFIEDTGAAQHCRDARILPIYEGTTAIQANDLLGRKTLRDDGATANRLATMIAETEAALMAISDTQDIAARLTAARKDFQATVAHLLTAAPKAAFGAVVPYLMLAGNQLAGWQMARSALAAHAVSDDFMTSKIATARFYVHHILPETALQRIRATGAI